MNVEKNIPLESIALPTPPVIGVKILEAVKSENQSSEGLARIISSDPALTVKILQVANSSFYALPTKVDSIPKAITVLGTNTLKNIALSFVIAKEFNGDDDDGFKFNFFWRRSITAAAGAECLASMLDLNIEDLFAAALLQDIGIVIMYLLDKGKWVGALEDKKKDRIPSCEAEQRHFGFDHQQLGAQTLEAWGLSENIHLPIRYHHCVDDPPATHGTQAHLLMLSDMISSVYHGSHSEEKIEEIKKHLATSHGIDPMQVVEMVDTVAAKSIEIMSLFDIPEKDMKPFSQILQEANAELGRLNMSYEQLLKEYRQAKEKAERLAADLQKANDKLQDLAYKDGLTGLNNHRQFQELMDKELSRSIRYKRPFSLILFDLDHFKKINDTYGHPAGDFVLKKVSRVLGEAIRASDTASRYGGEEFAMILPETDLKGAAILCERVRKSIADQKMTTGDVDIRVTVSCGFTSYNTDFPKTTKAELIAAADKALYNSKRSGRNRIGFIRTPE
ncbi:MAG: GGDEF domain-containing protein [Desulfobacteraceae bacterium]|nr:GGDEF domain-containing protein [Desulfobacteraceae bacterium]